MTTGSAEADTAKLRPTEDKRSFLRAVATSPKGLSGAIIISLVVLCAVFAPYIAPNDPARQDLAWRLAPAIWNTDSAAWSPLLGGDNLGRDLLSRVIHGARASVLIALSVVAVAASFGTLLGVVSGYFGGLVDAVISRFIDLQLAFPFMLLALVLLAVLGPGYSTLIFALALALWVSFARVARSETLRLRELEFIEASRSMGVGHVSIIFGHLIPNVLPAVLVIATLDVAIVVISEAALSYLGFGVQPPTPSWGGMISDGKDYIYESWMVVLVPGLAIFTTSIGINLFGDFLRDYTDPKLTKG